MQAFGGGLVDHRAEEDAGVLRIAGLELLRGGDQFALQCVVDVGVGVDALHADAALAGLVERAEDQPLHHAIELGSLVGVDDAGGVAAKLQRDLLAAGARLQIPADLAAGERKQLEARVLDQRVGMRAVQGEDRERTFRQVGLGQHFADDQRADRRLLRRLQHERAAGGDRRRHLVRDQVEREVERRDERDRPQRHAFGIAVIAVQTAGQFQVDGLAVDAHGFLGGDAEGLDQPGHFAGGILDRLARLDAQRLGQFVAAFGETLRAMLQHRLTRPRLVLAHRFRGLHRGGDRLLGGLGIRHGDAGGELAAVFVAHVQHRGRCLRLVGEVVGIGFLEHGRYGWRNRIKHKCVRCSAHVIRSVFADSQRQFAIGEAGAQSCADGHVLCRTQHLAAGVEHDRVTAFQRGQRAHRVQRVAGMAQVGLPAFEQVGRSRGAGAGPARPGVAPAAAGARAGVAPAGAPAGVPAGHGAADFVRAARRRGGAAAAAIVRGRVPVALAAAAPAAGPAGGRRVASAPATDVAARSPGVVATVAGDGRPLPRRAPAIRPRPTAWAARRSATKSAMLKSISWPTAETTGTALAWIARATASSLNAHRSSSEPPPRVSSSTS